MKNQIIDIQSTKRFIRIENRHLILTRTDIEPHVDIGKVFIEDIAAIIISSHGISLTSNVCSELGEAGIPVIFCGKNFMPVSMLFSIDGNYEQGRRMDAQLQMSEPKKKRLWQSIVKSKLMMQAKVLEGLSILYPETTIEREPIYLALQSLAKQTKSGDTDNNEAQGARLYWRCLFGADFRRERDNEGINSFLNYGYAVLRAAMARSIIAAGLHPTIGLFHRNIFNAFRLVDDLMEPFRPLVDLIISRFMIQADINENTMTLTPEHKKKLLRLMYCDFNHRNMITPFLEFMQKTATSLAWVCLEEQDELVLPALLDPLEIAKFLSNEVVEQPNS